MFVRAVEEEVQDSAQLLGLLVTRPRDCLLPPVGAIQTLLLSIDADFGLPPAVVGELMPR